MTATLPCAWCDHDNAPATPCTDCARPKCNLCGRCEPCIDGPPPAAEPYLLLTAAWLAGQAYAGLTASIEDPEIRGTIAMVLDPLFAITQAASPILTLAATLTNLNPTKRAQY